MFPARLARLLTDAEFPPLPICHVVTPRSILRSQSPLLPAVLRTLKLPITNTLLSVDDGVILNVNNVAAVKVEFVTVESEFIARSCNIFPPPPPPDGVNVHVFDAVRTRLPPFDVSRVSGVPLIVTPAAGVIVTVPAPRFRKFSCVLSAHDTEA